jgi:cation:H+ antiporter
MELVVNVFIFIIGLAVLIFSADILIQSCVKISLLFRLTPLFIGIIFVAFGTSLPEAGVGIVAALRNQKDIALGNIIGSNIANIGLILGLCSMFYLLKVNKSILRRELPIMLVAAGLLYLLSLDLLLSRFDGIIFIFSFLIFLFISYQGARKNFCEKEIQNFPFKKWFEKIKSPFILSAVIFLSLIGVVGGADLMVRGGVNLAKILGISTWIIGILVFAIGTSLPELVASLVASFKKVPAISIGNIVGSNIFNILFVLGVVSLIRPINLQSELLRFEYPVMFLFSVFLFFILRNCQISKKEGVGLFLGYLLFIFLLLNKK